MICSFIYGGVWLLHTNKDELTGGITTKGICSQYPDKIPTSCPVASVHMMWYS